MTLTTELLSFAGVVAGAALILIAVSYCIGWYLDRQGPGSY